MKTNKIKPYLYISLWMIASTKISPLALLVKTVALISSDYFYWIKNNHSKSRTEGQNSKLTSTSFAYYKIQAERFRISWSFRKPVLALSWKNYYWIRNCFSLNGSHKKLVVVYFLILFQNYILQKDLPVLKTNVTLRLYHSFSFSILPNML